MPNARLRAMVGIALVSLFLSTSACAHGDHGGGGGIVLPAGVTLVSLEYDVVRYNPVDDGRLGAVELGPHALRRVAVPTATFARGLTADLTLAVRTPYLANASVREKSDDGEIVDRGAVHGFGDLSFTGTWRFLREAQGGVDAAVIVGVKAPTGVTRVRDRFGERFDTHLQPGSGSWDGMIGATLTKDVGAVEIGANVLYTRAGRGSDDTVIGDRLGYGIAATVRLWASAATHAHEGHTHGADSEAHRHGGVAALDFSLGLQGLWSDKVREGGIADRDTGGNLVMLAPGLRLTVDRWAGYVNVGIPIAKDFNGLQSEPAWQLTTGLAARF